MLKRITFVLLPIVLSACGGLNNAVNGDLASVTTVASLTIEADNSGNGTLLENVVVENSQSLELHPVGRSASGKILEQLKVSWSLENLWGDLLVSADGSYATFVSNSAGTGRIIAKIDGVEYALDVTVNFAAPQTPTSACALVATQGTPYLCAPVGVNGSNYIEAQPANLALTWELVSSSTCNWASINAMTGAITGTPSTAGTCTLDIRTNNQHYDSEILQITLAVASATNNAPTINAYTCVTSLNEDVSYSCSTQPSHTDPDGPGSGAWSLDASNTCGWISINTSNGTLSGTPTDANVGTCTLAFKVNDDLLNSSVESYTVTINNVAPTLTISGGNVAEDPASAVEVKADATVQASDEGSGTYSFVIAGSTTPPACLDNNVSLTIDANTGVIDFKPTLNYDTTCNINVQFTDSNASSVTDEFAVTITSVNDIPTVDSYTCVTEVDEDAAYTCSTQPDYTDVDGPGAGAWSLDASNDCGWVSIDSTSGALSGTPGNGDVGTCTLAFLVNDGTDDSALESYTVTINNVTVYVWNLTTPAEYAFDSTLIDVSAGIASLKLVDQFHFGTDFSLGTFVGATLDSSNQLTLLERPSATSTDVTLLLPARAANLVGYWRLDNDWNDATANANHGTALGGPTFVGDATTKVGSHHGDFTGTGEGVIISDHSSLKPANFSLSIWFKGSARGNYEYLFAKTHDSNGTSFGIYTGSAAGLVVTFWDGSINLFSPDAGTGVWDEEWHHVVGSFDGSTIRLYVDGAEVGGGTANTNPIVYSTAEASIGSHYDGSDPSYQINAHLDEVALWNVALTAAEVTTLFLNPSASRNELAANWTPHWSDIVGYWNLDGDWLDSSGSGNDGATALGAPTYISGKIGTYAASFDGVDDRVEIPDDASLNMGAGDFSISAWVRKTTAGGVTTNDNRIAGKHNAAGAPGYWLTFNGDQPSFELEDSGATLSLTDAGYYIYGEWHHVVGVRSAGNTVKLFIDGVEKDSVADTLGDLDDVYPFAIGATTDNTFQLDGDVDEVAIWKGEALSAYDVSFIYNRQKQKYAGHYDSPVIDLGTSGAWDNIIPITTLPFLKSLTDAVSSETTANYASLVGSTGSLGDNDLSTGLVGLWHFEEAFYDGTADEVVDSSGSGNHGVRLGTNVNTAGGGHVSDRYATFSKTGSQGIKISSIPQINYATSSFTASLWINPTSNQTGANTYLMGNYNAGNLGWYILLRSSNDFRGAIGDGTNQQNSYSSLTAIHGWHHITYVVDRVNNRSRIYFDGVERDNDNIAIIGDATTVNDFHIGRLPAVGSTSIQADIDEVALWNRALDAKEVEQLFRRGGNRLRYQVKSCVDENCNCETYSGVAPGTNDCDGDSVLNVVDTDQTGVAEWLGRDATQEKTFSELQNCSTLNAGECSGSINSSPPSFTFSNFPMASKPVNNRYFQYRVLLEAEENSACTGTVACMPEVTSIQFDPTGRYYGGSPTIKPVSPSTIAYDNIQSMSFTTAGTCSLSYQLSKDGTNFFYWDGSNWVATTAGVSESNTAGVTNTNIPNFHVDAGTGSIYWQAFLTSDTTQSCQIDEISTTVVEP